MKKDVEIFFKTIIEKLNQIQNDILILRKNPVFSSTTQKIEEELTIKPLEKPSLSEIELEGWKLTIRNKKYWYLWKYCLKEGGKISQEWLYVGKNLEKAKEVLAKHKGKCLSPAIQEIKPITEIEKVQEDTPKPNIPAIVEAPKKEEEIKPLFELSLKEYLERIELVNATTKEMFQNIENPLPPTEKRDNAFSQEFRLIMEKSGWKYFKENIYRKFGNQFELKSNEIGLLRVGQKKKKQKIVISNFSPLQIADMISLGIPTENPVIITKKGGKTIITERF